MRGTGNEAPAVITTCNSAYADQFWLLEEVAAGYFQMRNVNSGKCLIVRGSANDARAVQYPCNAIYTDQHWSFDWREVGQLYNRNSGKCLYPLWVGNEAPVVQQTCKVSPP